MLGNFFFQSLAFNAFDIFFIAKQGNSSVKAVCNCFYIRQFQEDMDAVGSFVRKTEDDASLKSND